MRHLIATSFAVALPIGTAFAATATSLSAEPPVEIRRDGSARCPGGSHVVFVGEDADGPSPVFVFDADASHRVLELRYGHDKISWYRQVVRRSGEPWFTLRDEQAPYDDTRYRMLRVVANPSWDGPDRYAKRPVLALLMNETLHLPRCVQNGIVESWKEPDSATFRDLPEADEE